MPERAQCADRATVARMGRSVARRVAALALLAAALVAPGSTPAGAATARFVSGWVPYWNSADGRASFNTMPTMFEDISPFFATTNIDGSIGMLNTTAFRQTITDARAQGLTVLPSITDGTGNQMATLLGTP